MKTKICKSLCLLILAALILVMPDTAYAAGGEADTQPAYSKSVRVAAKEEELRSLSDLTKGSTGAFSLNVEGTAETGLFRSQLSGMDAFIYDALDDEGITAEKNGLTFRYNYQAGETDESVKAHLDEFCLPLLYAYRYDHMDCFNWNNNRVGMRDCRYMGTYMTGTLYYVVSEYYSDSLQKQADAVINQALASISGNTRYEKIRSALEWICAYGDYDIEALVPVSEEHKYYAHSAFGILLHQTGVCESYAKTMKILCIKLGIPCLLVDSDDHEFNYVKMEDGCWYMLDATWADQFNRVDYCYLLTYNIPYQDVSHTPVWGLKVPRTSYLSYSEKQGHDYRLTSEELEDCENSGRAVLSCSHCNSEKRITIPALGHDNVLIDSTYSADEGISEIVMCRRCGKKSTVHSDSCSAHNWESGEVTWEDDYHAAAMTVTCSRCGKSEKFRVLTVETVVRAPSCTISGTSTYKAKFVITLPFSADPSDFGATVFQSTVSATVTRAKLDHDYSDKVVAPTCMDEGYTLRTCNRCGSVRNDNYVAALGHDYAKSRRELTDCTKGGLICYSCSRCQAEKTEEIPAGSHSYKTTRTAATCTTAGKEVKTCKKCGKKVTKTLAMLGHDFAQTGRVLTDCTKGGSIYYDCSRCDETKEEVIPAADHSYDEGVIEREATTQQEGLKVYTCSVCQSKKNETIPKLVEKPARVLWASTPLSNYSNGIKLSWKNAGDAQGFYIYRSTDNVSFTKITTITDKTAVSYLDTDAVTNGQKYYYKLYACKKVDGKTYKSTVSSKNSIIRLSRPGIRSLENLSGCKMKLSWYKNSAANGYEIRYSTSSSFTSYKTVKITSNATLTKTISELTKGRYYYVKIRSLKTVDTKTYHSYFSTCKKVLISQ